MTSLLTKPKPVAMINPFHPLARGLVGCWLFNEMSGSLSNDISGYKNHGYFEDGSSWCPSRFGGGLWLDGGNNWIDCGSNPIFDSAFGTNKFTLSVWMYSILKTDIQGIINKRDSYYYSASPGGLFMDSNGTTLRFVLGTGNESETYDSITTILTSNTWYHIVGVADGTYMYLYRNGLLVSGPTAITKNPPTNDDNVTIGCQLPRHREFEGIIDEVRIYNRALSAHEVKQAYQFPFADIITPSLSRFYVAAAGTPWTGTMNGVTNPSKICGVSVNDILKVNGVASST